MNIMVSDNSNKASRPYTLNKDDAYYDYDYNSDVILEIPYAAMDLILALIICVTSISIFILRSKFQLNKLTRELRELRKEQAFQTEQIQHLQEEQRRLAFQVARLHLARVQERRHA
ncbi:Muscle calcium channel subunit alpha-1 [Folsomia candida]|uniref:Muscle calcium channel subunit alpha-1 n=1 Tax=Folsomia candida TaxID=158441 RepID=A0A226DYM2_FOLCA|nr:Muscle calcium channel subunit alpha-1 [Folsomia candida]